MTSSGQLTATTDPPLLETVDLSVWFPIRDGLLQRRTGWVRAVDGVSLHVAHGETIGVVGESGSGKTTLGRAIARLQAQSGGVIRLSGTDISKLSGSDLARYRKAVQMIFQDPYSSLDPRQRVGEILREPLDIHSIGPKESRPRRVSELLAQVGLNPKHAGRYPHQFSGGQRQRIGIARGLAVSPKLLVCDEPISALDVSIQAQIINLLRDLQKELRLTYVFIAHDLAITRLFADRIVVLYMGRIAETGPAELVYRNPRHPYTVALLSAIPVANVEIERRRRRIILSGEIPSPANPPSGCRFNTRCWLRSQLGNPEICVEVDPPLQGTETLASCHFSGELAAADSSPYLAIMREPEPSSGSHLPEM